MKTITLLALLYFNFSILFCQNETKKSTFTFDVTKFILPTLNNVGSMHGTPFTSITTNFVHYPRLTFGYKRRLKEEFDIGIDIGYGNSKLSLYKMNKDYQLIEFRPEIDYLFGSNKGNYVGFELFYIYNQDVFYKSS